MGGSHRGPLVDVDYSPDGRLLASCSDDGTVRLWDPAAGDLRGTWRLASHGSVVKRVLSAPAGRYLVTVNGNGTVYALRLGPPGAVSDR